MIQLAHIRLHGNLKSKPGTELWFDCGRYFATEGKRSVSAQEHKARNKRKR